MDIHTSRKLLTAARTISEEIPDASVSVTIEIDLGKISMSISDAEWIWENLSPGESFTVVSVDFE